MKRLFNFAFALACCTGTLVGFTSCGGSGGGNGGSVANKAVGLAPASITGLTTMTPGSANVNGTITFYNDASHTCVFEAPNVGTFTGNYTYTKVGANMAEVQLDNLRMLPINVPSDTHFTIYGFIRFISANSVVFEGTQTLVGQEDNGENSPFSLVGGSGNFSYVFNFNMSN